MKDDEFYQVNLSIQNELPHSPTQAGSPP